MRKNMISSNPFQTDHTCLQSELVSSEIIITANPDNTIEEKVNAVSTQNSIIIDNERN